MLDVRAAKSKVKPARRPSPVPVGRNAGTLGGMRRLARSAMPALRWLWTDDSGGRLLACLTTLLALLALGAGVLAWRAGEAVQLAEAADSASSRAPVARDRQELERLAEQLAERVERRVTTLGRALITLNHAEREVSRGGASFDLAEALLRYERLLRTARSKLERGEAPVAAVVDAMEQHGIAAYNSVNSRISDGLLLGAANCEGTSHLVVSLLVDLGYERDTFLRRFTNHVAPEFWQRGRAHHFGLTGHCGGRGVRVKPHELLMRFRAGAAPGGMGAFHYPETGDSCLDPGTLFDASAPLDKTDRVPHFWRQALTRPRGCAFPRMEWQVPRDQVLAVGTRVTRAERLSVSREALSTQSDHIACVERLLAQGLTEPDERLPFLGAAVGHYERGALLYAAAGQVRLVKELERRTALVRREAIGLIEKHITGARDRAIIDRLGTREVWPLIYLGEIGTELLFELSERRSQPRALAALLYHPPSRARAIALAGQLEPGERLELIDLLDFGNPWFIEDLTRIPGAHELVELERFAKHLERAWQSCELSRLRALVVREGAGLRWSAALHTAMVLRLATQSVADRCLETKLPADLRRFIREVDKAQAERVQRELDLIAMLK